MTAITLESVMAQWGASHKATVKPELIRIRLGKGYSKWRIQLVEVWPDHTIIGTSNLDSKVHWAEQTLANWSSVNRSSWDIWDFNSKKEAEKFILLYNLKWDQ